MQCAVLSKKEYDAMKKIEPIAFEDAEKLTAAEMNALHLETGLHSDADSVLDHHPQRRQP